MTHTSELSNEKHEFFQIACYGVRIFSWIPAILSFVAIVYYYNSLNDQLPVTRWTTSGKSWFVALRIPAINLCCLGIIETLARALARYRGNGTVRYAAPVLLLAGGVKSAVEGMELVQYPNVMPFVPWVLSGILLSGLFVAIIMMRPIFRREIRRTVFVSRSEKIAISLLVLFIAVLNLPLFYL